MLANKKHKLSCKVWIEYNNKPLIGKGGAEILQAIDKIKSISKGADSLGMSYRYVWNYLQDISNVLGAPIIETYKGGKDGGGGAKLTELGKKLLVEYQQAERYLDKVITSEVKTLKLSARNQLKGKVVAVEKGVITAKVKVEVNVPVTVTAVITKEAVEELDIKEGDEVAAIVKSTEIMIAK